MQNEQALFSFDPNAPVDVILVQLEPCIRRLAHRLANQNLAEWECDEITQGVLIKLARLLPRTTIEHPQAYLQRAIKNEITDHWRRRQPTYPLQTNDEGEPQGVPLLALSQGMGDPLYEVLQRVAFEELLDKLVAAILTLPPVQKKAAICHFRELVDDLAAFVEAFRRHNVDITHIHPPQAYSDQQRLRASYYVARLALAEKLKETSMYRKTDRYAIVSAS
ncbi:RNA polymerase sigma factor [Ktedonobacter racemifer]|uniref:RNA polymerase, sigma-24 subunit, ECF subfamily n=1 Tax=Ktedonobacter racemifer DSM 44963 TaxID=485913 RepID=D6TMJ0_KTERA|nr:sigma factor [Ktedonobacter racemifer]EFH86990.1 RNA polymerase, sigma-24 subunit, ECF subfamily [Ktedonobacter racemifer DSM 44963]